MCQYVKRNYFRQRVGKSLVRGQKILECGGNQRATPLSVRTVQLCARKSGVALRFPPHSRRFCSAHEKRRGVPLPAALQTVLLCARKSGVAFRFPPHSRWFSSAHAKAAWRSASRRTPNCLLHMLSSGEARPATGEGGIAKQRLGKNAYVVPSEQSREGCAWLVGKSFLRLDRTRRSPHSNAMRRQRT